MKATALRLTFLLILLTFFQLGCSEKPADKIADAQICLDKAQTTAEAEVCFAKVDGIDTASANGIRCSAKFIAEGFGSPSRITGVFQALEGTGGVTALMSLLTFTAKGTIADDTTNASNTFQYCFDSGGKGATLLMAFSNIAMSLHNLLSTAASGSGDCVGTPTGSPLSYPLADCLAAPPLAAALALAEVGNVNTNDATAFQTQSAIGNTVLATYLLSCSSGTAANRQLCEVFENAITTAGGTSNARAVAVALVTDLITP